MLPTEMDQQYSSPVVGTQRGSQQWSPGPGASRVSDQPLREGLLSEIGNVAWAVGSDNDNDNDVTLGVVSSLLSSAVHSESSSTVSSPGECYSDSHVVRSSRSGHNVETVYMKPVVDPTLQQSLVETFSAMGFEYDSEIPSEDEDDDGKENSTSIGVLSGKSRVFPLQFLSNHCALNNDEEDESSDDGSLDDEDDDDLILDEEPPYKERNPKIPEQESTHCLPVNVLYKTNDNVKFIENIEDIDDKTWLPRYFQGHRIKRSPILKGSSQVEYKYNRRCPKSSNGCETRCCGFKERTSASFISNLTCWRYERRHCLTGRVERMCRLCRGQNWVLKADFETHLLLSHGVLQPPGLSPSLLPLPGSVFEISQKQWINRSVECPHCSQWIQLGQLPDGQLQYSKSQGLYFNYFLHILKAHQDVHS